MLFTQLQCTTLGRGDDLGLLFASGLPTFVLIDPDGRVVLRGHDIEKVRAVLSGSPRKAE